VAGEHREEDAPRVAIVSTSINATPTAYARWAAQGDLIVAGDMNSPPQLAEFVDSIGGEYIHPDEQDFWPFSSTIGWRTIQRRNVAIMVAYARHYDYVATVDDDNHTGIGWVDQHVGHLRGHLPPNTVVAHGDHGWVDPGAFVTPSHHQRGVPFDTIREHPLSQPAEPYDNSLVVSTAQVVGDPDCDAVTRIVSQPRVHSVRLNAIVGVSEWTAFNSQATVWDGEWAPLMACIPWVGRYDDIIASFIAKRVMRAHNKTLYVGEPAVIQDRNVHDPISDLRAEYVGMQLTPGIVRVLDAIDLDDNMDLCDAYGLIVELFNHHQVLNPEALYFMDLWQKSWEVLQWTKEKI
jgi:hypothetical protein